MVVQKGIMMHSKIFFHQLTLIPFTLAFLNISSLVSAKETMGDWMFKRSGHPTTHIKKTGGTDGGGLVDQNVGLSEWAVKEPKPEEIKEKALVEKNLGLALPLEETKPSFIDEKAIVEKNEGLVDWVISDPKPDQVNERGVVQKNVHSIDWVVSEPKPKQIDEQGVVEENVDSNNPATGARKMDEGELVEYNLGIVSPIFEPKPKYIGEGGAGEDNVTDVYSFFSPQNSAGHLAGNSVGNTAINVQSNLSNVGALRNTSMRNSLKSAGYDPSSATKGLFNN